MLIHWRGILVKLPKVLHELSNINNYLDISWVRLIGIDKDMF